MKIETGRSTITLSILLAIYSISMVTSLPGLAISPILGKLEGIFKGTSELHLQMLESLPSFIIVPFILIAGRLSLLLNKKRLLIIGLTIFFISSILYLFANSLTFLLIISALLGIGAGMVIPFSTGLVADYFTGERRTRQLGIVSAITNITLVIATFLAGYLAGISWHLSFLVYCFSGISLIFSFFLENTPPYHKNEDKKNVSATSQKEAKSPRPIKLMFFYYLVTFLALSIPLNLAIYMRNLKMGNYDTSGTLISIFFLSMTLPGFFINNILNKLKHYTLFISLVCITIGLAVFTFKSPIIILTIGVILIGLGYGAIQPIIYDRTTQNIPPAHATYALSLVMVMNYIAIITYPFILKILEIWFSPNSVLFPYILTTIICLIFTIFAFFRRHTPVLG